MLSTESPKHFERILGGFITAIEPVGAIEQMWIYDIAVLVWEMMRLRRYKAMIIEKADARSISGNCESYIGDDGESDESETFADIYYRAPRKIVGSTDLCEFAV